MPNVVVKHLDGKGISRINGKQQGTAFGADIVSATEVPIQASKYNMGIPLKGLDYVITTSGYINVDQTDITLNLNTGTDPAGAVEIYSKTRIRYEAGSPGYEKITIAFVDPNDTNGDLDCAFGLYDGEDGFLLKQEIRNGEESFYFDVLKSNVIDKHIPINGVFDEYNTHNLEIYRIIYGFLGVAPTEIYRKNQITRLFDEIHYQTYAQRSTAVREPELPVGGYIKNLGNTNDVNISSGSFQVGIIDGGSTRKRDPNAREKTIKTITTLDPGSNYIWAFENPSTVEMYDFIDITDIPTLDTFKNIVSSDLTEVGYSVDANKFVTLNIYITPNDNITATFTPVELGWSVLSVADNPVVIDPAQLEVIKIIALGKLNSDIVPINRQTLLTPGFTAVFELVLGTGGTGEAEIVIAYQDLF